MFEPMRETYTGCGRITGRLSSINPCDCTRPPPGSQRNLKSCLQGCITPPLTHWSLSWSLSQRDGRSAEDLTFRNVRAAALGAWGLHRAGLEICPVLTFPVRKVAISSRNARPLLVVPQHARLKLSLPDFATEGMAQTLYA